MKKELSIDKEFIKDFCEKNHIKRLSLFGSYLNGESNDDSDIDILVEFENNHLPGLFGLTSMEIALSDKLAKKIDLRTPEDLSEFFREKVVSNARILYG